MAKQITEAFTSWFANVTTRLDDTKRKELAPLLDVVFFAAQEQNYIPSNSQQHLSFYFRNTVSDICGKTATGCFAGWAMDIYVSLSSDGNLLNRTLTHEIGHALQMNDLYKGEIPPESGYYSSQENLSIMNRSKALTCDDADAIINALYLAAQKVGRKLPDVHFTSFCKNGAVYHNGRMLNHPPCSMTTTAYAHSIPIAKMAACAKFGAFLRATPITLWNKCKRRWTAPPHRELWPKNLLFHLIQETTKCAIF